MDNYNLLSNKYDTFIYEGYKIENNNSKTIITFDFNIPNLTHFYPTLELKEFKNDTFTNYLIFHIGLVELISYWKCTCSKNVIIKAGYLDSDQITFFKKLYYYGLGELFYRNNITLSYNDFMNIKCSSNKTEIKYPEYNGIGNLIPIGGGKDSNVTLEILEPENNINNPFIINPKDVNIQCAKIAGYKDDKIITIKRTIDKNLIDLNNKGFINGHTPFSALVAFVSYLTAYTNNKKYIILSNESSANESNVEGTKINHQYSKTYEFENDFNNYTNKYFKINIKYFSLLRPLSEYQIALLFSNYKKYHQIFKSCNVGSKEKPWKWCCNCPKCLFVYIILSPFLYKDKLVEIFKEDLFTKKELLKIFIELTGNGETKPFECVGTYSEVNYALTQVINKTKNLPYLLEYYKEHYKLEDETIKPEKNWNNENNLEPKFVNLLKGELEKYVK